MGRLESGRAGEWEWEWAIRRKEDLEGAARGARRLKVSQGGRRSTCIEVSENSAQELR